MDQLVELMKWLPQGGAAAVAIITVSMFLKQWDKVNELLKSMRDGFSADLKMVHDKFSGDLKETRDIFAEKLENVTTKFSEQHEAQIKVNVETVAAINGLRADVHALKEKQK